MALVNYNVLLIQLRDVKIMDSPGAVTQAPQVPVPPGVESSGFVEDTYEDLDC